MERLLARLDQLLPPSLLREPGEVLSRARMLVVLLCAVPCLSLLVLGIHLLGPGVPDALGLGCCAAGVASGALIPLFRRTGSIHWVGNLLVGFLSAIAMVAAATAGGTVLLPTLAAVLLPTVATILCGARSGLSWVIATAVSIGAIGAAHEAGLTFPRSVPIAVQEYQRTLGPLVQLGMVSFLILVHEWNRRRSAEELERAAFHDGLTGLRNRRSFVERLDHAVDTARSGGHAVALLFVDLDGFKILNDRHGHAAGDFVLEEVSRRIADSVRYSDEILGGAIAASADDVSRIGGDEFTILLPRVDDGAGADVVARRILDGVNDAIAWNDTWLEVRCSIGIAMFPAHADDAATLLQRADAAMYAEKRMPQDGVRFYEAEPGR